MEGTFVRGCRCAKSRCDLDLTFDFAVVTLSLKILSGLYLRNHMLLEVICKGKWLEDVGEQQHSVTLI